MKEGSKIYSLEAITADPLATRNTVLFACLTALGIEPELSLCGEYVEKIGGREKSVTVWRLKDRSICGRYVTAEMIKAFNDPDFSKTNPEHPLSYLRCGFENHRGAVDFINDQGPIVVVRRGSKVGLITRHTPEARRKRILSELSK